MQELNGFVKLYRKLKRWGWYKDNVVKCLFLHFLLTASFKDFEWMGRSLKAGQLVTGRKKLAEELGLSEQQIRTGIKKLESTKEITIETTSKFTIVTVVNWEDYQGEEKISTNRTTNTATNGQPADLMNKLLIAVAALENSTNKATNKNELESLLNSGIADLKNILSTKTITNEQPTSNQQLTNKQPHIKNIKNNKNIRSSSTGGCAAQLSEILAEISEYGLNVNGKDFYEHYSGNGWRTEDGRPIKDWKKLLRIWDAKELRKKPVYANGYAGVKKLTDD